MPDFHYDAFQKEAIAHIKAGTSVLVSAPTGAGKTVVAEHVITDCLQKKTRVIYTAPIKALSNQKYRDFQKQFPGQVGILTGDVVIEPHAPALIMTTEIFRNKLLESGETLHDYAWVIFDEIHYLDDEERGSVWEESLIFLPRHMNLLGLSATIPNIDELAEWFRSIHNRPLAVIKEDKRPVPLHFYYQCQGRLYESINQLSKQGYYVPGYPQLRGRRLPRFVPIKPNRTLSLIKHLKDEDRLPCIYFAFGRRRTEELAEEMLGLELVDGRESRRLVERFDELCARFEIAQDSGAVKMRPLIAQGLAYHHAGMLPTLKEVIERMFTDRLIRLIVTTETFALGINMPARSVVFDELRKFYGTGFRPLKTRDFYQMAGRAGRRSIDTEGYVYCRINPHDIAPWEIRRIVNGTPEKVVSRFNTAYATLLNLYQTHQEALYDIYPLSFHFFQTGKKGQKKVLEAMRQRVNLLKDLGYIRKNALTPKGMFAARVYGYELVLAELYEDGFLETMSVPALAVFLTAVVHEPRKGARKPDLPGWVRIMEKHVDRRMKSILRREKRAGIRPLSKTPAFHLAPLVSAWMKGASFEEAMRLTDADEGEVVRALRMAIQVAREMAEGPITDEFRRKLRQAREAVNRDVVDAERQLRRE